MASINPVNESSGHSNINQQGTYNTQRSADPKQSSEEAEEQKAVNQDIADQDSGANSEAVDEPE